MRWMILILTLAMSVNAAYGQSHDRVAEQVVRNSGRPGPEDFAIYLRSSSFYDLLKKTSKAVKDPVKLIEIIRAKLEETLPPENEAQLLLQLHSQEEVFPPVSLV